MHDLKGPWRLDEGSLVAIFRLRMSRLPVNRWLSVFRMGFVQKRRLSIFSHWLITRAWPLLGAERAGPRVFEHHLRFFSQISQKRRGARRRRSWHTCSYIFSAYILKIVDPGHSRSGHQVTSSDLTSESLNARHRYTEWLITLKLSPIDIRNNTYKMFIS